MADEMMTSREVAKRIKRDRKTVLGYLKRGLLEAIQYDGVGPWMFYASSVDRFLGLSPEKPKMNRVSASELNREILARQGIVPHAERARPLSRRTP